MPVLKIQVLLSDSLGNMLALNKTTFLHSFENLTLGTNDKILKTVHNHNYCKAVGDIQP